MPFPREYSTASADFERFLDEVRTQAMRQTRNQAYAMTRAVLHVFRDHLSVRDALDFADLLPPLLRALYIDNWHPSPAPPLFPDRAALLRQVLDVRQPHNTAPQSAISDVATVLRRHVDQRRFDQLLARLPAGAVDYWAP
ncbi:MAG: hypothetical protein BroJett030_02020 [Alphaproteobacteria bacterium]|nr:MAG: hypothetical protein BroJett030_02020 [Alphaproteobacteria bacterium]